MLTIEVIDNPTGKLILRLPVSVPEPVDVLFTKDRQTKQNYLYIRTKGELPDGKNIQKFPVEWDQYSNVTVREARLTV